MSTINIKDIKDSDLVTILHMDDYFPEGVPQPFTEKMMTFKQFKQTTLAEILEDCQHSSIEEAFEMFASGSGDGDENYCLLVLKDQQIYAVSYDME